MTTLFYRNNEKIYTIISRREMLNHLRNVVFGTLAVAKTCHNISSHNSCSYIHAENQTEHICERNMTELHCLLI